jgi:Alpha/beta hydrolase family
MGKHFLLIHGAWHGGWCWEGVIEKLEQTGHTAEAPTMPGHGRADDRSTVRYNLIEVEGGHETLCVNPGVVAEVLQRR